MQTIAKPADVTSVPTSTLARRLAASHFVMTAEIVPPVSCEAEDLLARALPLNGVADAVNVTDGAGARAHMAATARRRCSSRPASTRSFSSPAATATASRSKAN